MRAWFADVYQKRWEHRPSSSPSSAGSMPLTDPLYANGVFTADSLWLSSYVDMAAAVLGPAPSPAQVAMQRLLKQVLVLKSNGSSTVPLPPTVTLADLSLANIASKLSLGHTYIFKLSRLAQCFDHDRDGRLRPAARVRRLKDSLDRITGFYTTAHMYTSSVQGLQALPRHTDPYDALIVQTNGSKTWEICAPTLATVPHAAPEGFGPAAGAPGRADQGELSMLHELHYRGKWSNEHILDALSEVDIMKVTGDAAGPVHVVMSGGAGSRDEYTDVKMETMDCSTVTLHPGDRLYVPTGIMHRVVSGQSPSSPNGMLHPHPTLTTRTFHTRTHARALYPGPTTPRPTPAARVGSHAHVHDD